MTLITASYYCYYSYYVFVSPGISDIQILNKTSINRTGNVRIWSATFQLRFRSLYLQLCEAIFTATTVCISMGVNGEFPDSK